MERVATVAKVVWPLLGLSLLLLQLQGAQGRRLGSAQGMLPPCNEVPGGIPGWDCYDPPTHPLPALRFQAPADWLRLLRLGPPASDVNHAGTSTSESQGAGHVQGELPPCNQVAGGIPGWDCYDPPTHPLPPCDFQHQRIGFDCSGWPPAAGH